MVEGVKQFDPCALPPTSPAAYPLTTCPPVSSPPTTSTALGLLPLHFPLLSPTAAFVPLPAHPTFVPLQQASAPLQPGAQSTARAWPGSSGGSSSPSSGMCLTLQPLQATRPCVFTFNFITAEIPRSPALKFEFPSLLMMLEVRKP